jgi:hypothetical protein
MDKTKDSITKTLDSNGQLHCPVKGEGIILDMKAKRLYSYKYGNVDNYEYPLIDSGIKNPVAMKCIPEMNLVQIFGFDQAGDGILGNFVGGESEKAAFRLHSTQSYKDIKLTGGKKFVGISTGYNQNSSFVTTYIETEVAANADMPDGNFSRFLLRIDLNGPAFIYKAPELTAQDGQKRYKLNFDFKGFGLNNNLNLTVFRRMENVEVKSDPSEGVKNPDGSTDVDLEKISFLGDIVDAEVTAPGTLTFKRKNNKGGLTTNAKLDTSDIIDIHLDNKFAVIYSKTRASPSEFKLEWEFNPISGKGNTDVTAIPATVPDNQKGELNRFVNIKGEENEVITIVSTKSAKLRIYSAKYDAM